MVDPRLKSVHLKPERREEFRRAREALVEACGELTQHAEKKDGSAALPTAPTRVESWENRLGPDQPYALVDGEALFPLKVGINTVGRLVDNDVVIPDPFVSRRHCAILVHAHETCELHDVASKNGTFLNGKPVQGPMPLNSGDEIRLCDRPLIFVGKVPPHPAADLQTKVE